jgi:EAL domain-containing protein (putative c-di-GMP-specific phosphodiesterase class I)
VIPAAADPAAAVSPAEWSAALDAVVAEPERLRMVFQPIADLRRAAVAGYEALARFSGPPSATPDVWFRAAAGLGREAELEALAVRKALQALPDLPANTFLTLNVSPHLLDAPQIRAVFDTAPTLSRVVVELTEHVPVHDLDALAAGAERLRRRGAMIAVDDAGAGYSGLAQIAAVRPQLVKLDRSLVADVDRNPAKLALAELLGEYASRLDAWLLAEGVETVEELAAFARIGVPLAQGWLFARPSGTLDALTPEIAELIRREGARAQLSECVVSLVVHAPRAPLGTEPDDPFDPAAVILIDPEGVARELSLADPRTGRRRTVPVTLRVHPSTPTADVARRAMTRAPAYRFDPAVCADPSGRLLGVVMVDDLVQHLAGRE